MLPTVISPSPIRVTYTKEWITVLFTYSAVLTISLFVFTALLRAAL